MTLRDAVVCLNCDGVSELAARCRACGSEHLMPLARWLGVVVEREEASA